MTRGTTAATAGRVVRLALALGPLTFGPLAAAERAVADADGLAAAAKAARPGDVIVMRDGVWRDADLVFEAHGTEGGPITLRAETPGKVVLAGRSRLRIAGEHLVVDGLWFKGDGPGGGTASDADVIEFRRDSKRHARRCRLTNCAVTDFNPPDGRTETKWVSLYGADNRVDHCRFAGKANAGATLVVWVAGGPNRHLVDRNDFGPRPRLGRNGGETIRVGTSDVQAIDSRTVVERNLFRECDGEIEIVSNKSCGNVYRSNTFLDCAGALTLRHGDRCVVEGNVFLGHGKKNTGGVRVVGEDHRVVNNYFAGLAGGEGRSALTLMNGLPDSPPSGYARVKRATVAFNTFVDCRSPLLIGYAGDEPTGPVLPPEGCLIADNVVVGTEGPFVRIETEPADLRWAGNLFHGARTGLPPTPGVAVIDPQLRPAADGLLRPAATSPAVDAASSEVSCGRDDFDGQPRDARPDVGCDEVSDARVAVRPVNSADVGPEWMQPR